MRAISDIFLTINGVHERLHGVLFNDVDRLGGGNDLTVAAAGILDHGVALFRGDAVGGLLVVERADGLRGLPEGGIVLVHQHLRHQRAHGFLNAARRQLVGNAVLQMIAVPLLILGDFPHEYVPYAANVFLWASLIMTVYSGIEYIWQNRKVFSM